MIPHPFLTWFAATYKEQSDCIDLEHEYDRTLSIEENKTLFMEKFPTGEMHIPKTITREEEDFIYSETYPDEPEEAITVCYACNGAGENGICEECTARGLHVDFISGSATDTAETLLEWYNEHYSKRKAFKAVLVDSTTTWTYYAVVFEKVKR